MHVFCLPIISDSHALFSTFEHIFPFFLYNHYLFRWGTTDRTVGGDIPNNTVPYVRRRSGAGINESTPPAAPSTLVSVTSSLPPPTTNVTVTSFDDPTGGKRRSNRGDEEAEAQRKHRSAQARRERRSTQSVSVEDIKAAEQQIKNRPNEISSSNNKIGAPSTPVANEIETERLQKVIEDKKDKARKASGGNEVNTHKSHNFFYSSLFHRIPLK